MRPFSSTISVDAARSLLGEHVRPIERIEQIELTDAAWRVAAAEVTSTLAVPPFARSVMDGYAVTAADTTGSSRNAPVTLRIIDRVYTGQSSRARIVPGTCAEIATGAP